MSSIFGRLFKYRPRPNRDPKEDFFTEAFAGVLKKSPTLRSAFVYWLIEQEVDFVYVRTQKTMPTGRIDIWIDARSRHNGTRHLVAIESKIGADVVQYQLRRYEAHLRSEAKADSRTLISATCHERSRFRRCLDAPDVQFRQIHWFQVADFLRNWISRLPNEWDDPSVPFVRELLLLMEEWSMAMTLNVDDLAAATSYHTSVYARLVQILEQTKEGCNLPQPIVGNWSGGGRTSLYLARSSPWFGEFGNGPNSIYVEFGFDFERDDADWNVAHLRLPSAYFTFQCPHLLELHYPEGWESPPAEWGEEYRQVKHLACLQVNGETLHIEYLEFFQNARDELWHALGI